MPVLKYRDPNDPTGNTWLPVSYGGTGGGPVPNEVLISDTTPTDPEVELWLDKDEPAVPLDAVTKAQADTDYVNVTGDTMSGSLTLSGAVNDSWIHITSADTSIYSVPDGLAFVDAGHSIYKNLSVADPTESAHAATKAYVDRDTGARNISSMINTAEGWSVAGGAVVVRRNGNNVSLTFSGLSASADIAVGSPLAGMVPQGFSVYGFQGFAVTAVPYNSPALTTLPGNLAILGTNIVDQWVFYNGYKAGTLAFFTLQYITEDNWPTTLPGTEVLSADGQS